MENLTKKIFSPRNLGTAIAIISVTAATAAAAIPAYKSWLIQGSNLYTTGTNVGIGTTTPGAKLHIYDQSPPFPIVQFRIGERLEGVHAGISTSFFSSDSIGNDEEYARVWYELADRVNGQEASLIHFDTRTGGGPVTRRLTIQGNGNIGIGTVNPTEKLQVAGVIHSTTGGIKFPDGTVQTTASGGGAGGWTDAGTAVHLTTPTDKVGIGTSNPKAELDVRGTLNIQHPTNNAAVIYYPNTGALPHLFIRSDNDPSTYEPASERMYISNTGGVGIGTINPKTNLDVRGNFNIQTPGNNAGVIYFPKSGALPNLYIRSDDDPITYEPNGCPAGSERLFIGGPSAQVGINNVDPGASLGIVAGLVIGSATCPSSYIVFGPKFAAVQISDGTTRLLHAQESPEIWFEDFGSSQLVNGKAHIELDPLFLETVTVNAKHPMKVFVELNGETNGVYVVKGTTGFDVIERAGGVSNAPFDYRVVAKRKRYEDFRLGQTAPSPTQ